ncbi:MAG: carboxypeptidase regulatory-like domain-containing protein [Haloarculaceae archaeon]
MVRLRLSLVALFFVVLVGASPTVVAAQDVTLTVTVVDADGDPVSDVDISVTWAGGGPVNETTRANGQALVDVPEGVDAEITIHDDEYVRNTPYVVENATTREVDVPVARSGTATVEVVDSEGPVENAIVRMFKSGTFVVNSRTDADGQITTRPIEHGDYSTTVIKQGYLRNRTTVTVGNDTTKRIEIERGSVLVTFDVSDDHFSPARPVENATVTVGTYGSVTTLENGEATIRVPVNREYEVSVTKDGYDTATRTLDVDESATAMNVTIQRTPTTNITAVNDRVVVGETTVVTVTDEYDDPIPNATVSLDGERVGETDSEGELAVPIDSAGEHTLSASASGNTDETTVEGVEPGAETTATVTGSPTGTPSATQPRTTGGGTGALGPGFTPLAALVAVLAVALGVALRRR